MPFSTDFNEVVQQLVGADRSEPPTHGQVLHCKPEHLSNPGQPVTSWLNVAPQRSIGALTAPTGNEPKMVSKAWNQLSAARFSGAQVFAYQLPSTSQPINFRSFSFFAVVWRSAAATFPIAPEALFSARASESVYSVFQFANQASTSPYFGASQLGLYGSSYLTPTPNLRVPMRPTLVGLVSRPTGCTWVAGDQMGTSPALTAGTASLAGIGGQYTLNGAVSLFGDLFEVMMYDRALSDREISRIAAYVALKYGIDDGNEQLLFLGNSLSAGYKLEHGQSWPQLIAPQLRSRQSIFNESITGITTTTLSANAGNTCDRYFDSSRFTRNTVIVWEGTNDLALSATGGNFTGYATTCYSKLEALCTARRTAGWKVIIMTLLPRGGTDVNANPANFETARLQVNSSIRANWQNFADGIIDVASLPFAADASQLTNLQWYLDTVHLTAEGQKAVANLALPVLRNLDLLKK